MNKANAEPINNIYDANTNLARQKKYLVAFSEGMLIPRAR